MIKKTENEPNGLKRKCACCGEFLYITKQNVSDAIYYDKKTYHSKCFEELYKKRILSKNKVSSSKWKWVSDNIEKIKLETYDHIINMIAKDDVYNFIRDTYDLTVVPSSVFQKLHNIYQGTFKGMSVGIPPVQLLDMWKRKIGMLDNIADKNRTMGNKMSPEHRLNYDLSILINKYDSYIKWLEKQKILEIEQKQIEKKDNITKTIINTKIKPINETSESDDILDLVDEIFG